MVEPRPLVIDQHLLQEILEHCRDEKPNEACGILTGRDGLVLNAYATDSLHRSPIYYEVDPEQQEWILRSLAERGEELVAIYHSHPSARAFPSATDVRLAVHYPDAIRVIISLAGGPAEPRAFLIKGQDVHELRWEIPLDRVGVFHDLRGGNYPSRQKNA